MNTTKHYDEREEYAKTPWDNLKARNPEGVESNTSGDRQTGKPILDALINASESFSDHDCPKCGEHFSTCICENQVLSKGESVHTPGPWRMEIQNGYINIIGANGDFVIADWDINEDSSVGIRVNHEREVANFKLIAAAPETSAERDKLREQVRELLAILQRETGHDYSWNGATYDQTD